MVFSLLISACATHSQPSRGEAPAANAPLSPALFQIVRDDGSIFDVTLDSVKTLPLAQLNVEGKVQEGPRLKDVLALAGVTEFTSIDLTGSAGPATLTFAQVDDHTILDFNNHGTMKLATIYIPMPGWTKDVSKITVK